LPTVIGLKKSWWIGGWDTWHDLEKREILTWFWWKKLKKDCLEDLSVDNG
jgi:hypothetical protein